MHSTPRSAFDKGTACWPGSAGPPRRTSGACSARCSKSRSRRAIAACACGRTTRRRDTSRPSRRRWRQKTFLYPVVEVANLVGCKRVPRAWREVYVVAAYTYVRPEELQAVTWNDVDLLNGTDLDISKAIDARTCKPKPLPKTQNAVRSVPIERELLPLLQRMRKDADDSGAADDAPILPVLGELNDRYRAKQLREHLHAARSDAASALHLTATLLQVDFRLVPRHGHPHWLAALAGVGVDKMQRRAGHEDLSTTLGYVKMAEDLAGKVGTPFPPLPRDLVTRLEPGLEPRFGPSWRPNLKNTGGSGAGGGNRTPDLARMKRPL